MLSGIAIAILLSPETSKVGHELIPMDIRTRRISRARALRMVASWRLDSPSAIKTGAPPPRSWHRSLNVYPGPAADCRAQFPTQRIRVDGSIGMTNGSAAISTASCFSNSPKGPGRQINPSRDSSDFTSVKLPNSGRSQHTMRGLNARPAMLAGGFPLAFRPP